MFIAYISDCCCHASVVLQAQFYSTRAHYERLMNVTHGYSIIDGYTLRIIAIATA